MDSKVQGVVGRRHPLTFFEWYGREDRTDLPGVDWAGAYQAYATTFLADRAGDGGVGHYGRSRLLGCESGEGNVVASSHSVGSVCEGVAGAGSVYDLEFGSAIKVDTRGIGTGDGDAVRFVVDRKRDRAVLRDVSESVCDVGCGAALCGEGTLSGVVSDPAVADTGDVSAGGFCGPVRGKNYESNRRKRLSRKRRGVSGRVDVELGEACSSGPDQSVPTFREFVEERADSEVFERRCLNLEERLADEAAVKSAKRTLNEKWAMENKLALAKAKRALEVLEAQDLQAEIKKQSTYLRLQTEKNMVGMEKAHQFLKRTGNVPGFAQTVVSDEGLTDGSSASPVSPGECTISPDSSASMKEFRELVKKNADLQAKLDQFHKMTKIHPDYIELYKKQTWTINSENIRILDEMYPQGHALNPIPDYENYEAPTHGELIVGRDEEYFPY